MTVIVNSTRQQQILDLLADFGEASSTELSASLELTRQGIQPHLQALLADGAITKSGRGRATRYQRASEAPAHQAASGPGEPVPSYQRSLPIAGLEEDRVWEELRAGPLRELPDEAVNVFSYAVTEIVNNAIDHSGADEVRLSVRPLRGGRMVIVIEDQGVGAFAKVKAALGLPTELDALLEITKGKTTTAPDRHTGEGLFFVSKAVDIFRLESGGLAWVVDNLRSDFTAQAISPRIGTRVVLELDPVHPRDLTAIFEEHTDDYEFARTRAVIKLFETGVRFVSRSEAKRLVHGLEKFREVIMDFHGVTAVGQGFADEVFRVWAKDHPEVDLTPVNMVAPVEMMVSRARSAAARHR